MEEQVRLELFTVRQVRQWLKTGKGERGLSDEVIPRTRAWAIINGPYAQEDDPVVVAIFVNNRIAAHVLTFPELINGERYWWFPDLWCAPEHEGKGYSLIVIGTIAEMFGADHCLDKWGAPEAVNVFQYLGLKVTYLPRYVLGPSIDISTAKGKFVHAIRAVQKLMHRVVERPTQIEPYSLRYLSFIDNETYDFIAAHRNNDYFLHTQEFMNWVLQYPFSIAAPMIERVKNVLSFAAAETPDTQLYAVSVYYERKIIGFYLLKRLKNELHVLYLYYDSIHKTQVFASIRDHILRLSMEQCYTENNDLAIYLRQQIYFPKCTQMAVSFTYPSSMKQPIAGNVQYGDGDCFAL